MFLIPLHGFPDGSIVAVIDGLPLASLNVRLHSKVIEENVKAFVLVLSQADEAMVQWQRTILDLFEHCLEDNHILKSSLDFKDVHTGKKGISVRNDVVAVWKSFSGGRPIRENEWRDSLVVVGRSSGETSCA